MSDQSQIVGRKFLFLQGPIGLFFSKLADSLILQGAEVLKVNFNGGDDFFWRYKPAIEYTYQQNRWAEYISDIARLQKVTDLVVYGDCRPLHKEAIDVLKPLGVKIHVFEEGYFRPDWITLESDGVNAYSSLPSDKSFYLEQDVVEPKVPQSCGVSFYYHAFNTLNYYLASVPTLHTKFKNYKHHFGNCPHKTMMSWVPRVITSFYRKLESAVSRLRLKEQKYFLVTLQLARDWQIISHSRFGNIDKFIDYVCENFSENAPADMLLVFKNHPLDNGLQNVKSMVQSSADKYGITNRVQFLDGWSLPKLIKKSEGVVTVNSTSGLSVMHHHKPLIALGRAIYNFEGLASQSSLADFWNRPQKPDQEVYEKFRNYVINKCQINGSFYNPKGIDLAVRNCVPRMLGLEPNKASKGSLKL